MLVDMSLFRLKNFGWEILQTTYSPNFVPSDFQLFSLSSRSLSVPKFKDVFDIQNSTDNLISSKPGLFVIIEYENLNDIRVRS